MAARHAVNPNQLRMFMTPTEITQHYSPLEGDREEVEAEDNSNPHNWGLRSENDTELWDRKLQESHMRPQDYHEMRDGETPKKSSINIDDLAWRSSYPRLDDTSPTTSAYDEHFHHEGVYLDRKAREKSDAHYERMHGPSLWESVKEHGVQHPVHLGVQFGEREDKPEVVGGHHRIAAALDIDPHGYIPVLHHEDIYDAKNPAGSAARAGFKYT